MKEKYHMSRTNGSLGREEGNFIIILSGGGPSAGNMFTTNCSVLNGIAIDMNIFAKQSVLIR